MTHRRDARRKKGSHRQVPRRTPEQPPKEPEPRLATIVRDCAIDDPAREAMEYWRAAALPDPAFVYFIQGGWPDYGPVKIGKAADPTKRLAELQCGNPAELRIRSVILAGQDTERSLHSIFRQEAWIRGEWFGQSWERIILAFADAASTKQMEMHRAGKSAYEVVTIAPYMAVRLVRREAA